MIQTFLNHFNRGAYIVMRVELKQIFNSLTFLCVLKICLHLGIYIYIYMPYELRKQSVERRGILADS